MKLRDYPQGLLLLLLCALPTVSLAAPMATVSPAAVQPAIKVVNINQASVEELASQLKGIGRKRAQAIVNYRETQGPFVSLEQLVEVPGISTGMLEQNRSRLVLISIRCCHLVAYKMAAQTRYVRILLGIAHCLVGCCNAHSAAYLLNVY